MVLLLKDQQWITIGSELRNLLILMPLRWTVPQNIPILKLRFKQLVHRVFPMDLLRIELIMLKFDCSMMKSKHQSQFTIE